MTKEDIILKVKIDQIFPNPYQPESRTQVDKETAKKFGESILQHGLIQTPICRPRKAGDGIGYEMGDGWLRLEGYRYLRKDIDLTEYSEVPIVLRDLTDRQMADLVMEANMVRQDLTPIEEAQFYKRCIDELGVTQTEIAKAHNKSQGEIANTMRLLELPDELQGKVISQEIPRTHARHLLRLNAFPELQNTRAEECIKRGTSVDELSNLVAQDLYQKSEGLEPSKGGYYRGTPPVFDTSECKDCEFRQKIGAPFYNERASWRCTNPECWQKKQGVAMKAKKKKALAELKKEGVTKVYGRNELNWDQCNEITDYALKQLDSPEECKGCENWAKRESYREGVYEDICIDTKCWRRKQIKHTKEENRLAREKEHKKIEGILATVKGAGNGAATLRIAAECLLQGYGVAVKKPVVDAFELPTEKRGKIDNQLILDAIQEKSEAELLQIVAALVLTNLGYQQDKRLPRYLAMLEGKLEEYIEEVESFKASQCALCSNRGNNKDIRGEVTCYSLDLDDEGKCTHLWLPEEAEKRRGKMEAPPPAEPVTMPLPCDTCALADECDRSQFYQLGDEYICEEKVAANTV